MEKKIKCSANSICIDETHNRFFLLGAQTIGVYDTETLRKISQLDNFSHRNCIYISQKNNLIIVSSTVGEFGFFSLDNLSLQGKVKIKNCDHTDEAFYYDEESNTVCGIYIKSLRYFIYRIFPETLQYSVIPLEVMRCNGETKTDKPVTRYNFHKYCSGSYYLLVNFYDVGINACIYETFYGRYEIEDARFVLKEKLLSVNDRHLELYHINEKEQAEQIDKMLKQLKLNNEYLRKIYRCESGLFIVTQKAVYHLKTDVGYEEVYRDSFMSDYAEYNNKRFICTWQYCLVQNA